MSQPIPPGSPGVTAETALGGADDPLDSSRREFIVTASTVAGAMAVGVPAIAVGQPGSGVNAAVATTRISLTVNGSRRELEVDPRQSLLDVLREALALTGTKKGCNQGACGACTVIVNDRRIVSCLALAALYDGASVTTIEGLSEGDQLHPLQAAFIEHEGFQCGYCTSGQIMSGVACIKEGHASTPDEVQYWMSGNICRCGCYIGITTAIAEVAQRGQS